MFFFVVVSLSQQLFEKSIFALIKFYSSQVYSLEQKQEIVHL